MHRNQLQSRTRQQHHYLNRQAEEASEDEDDEEIEEEGVNRGRGRDGHDDDSQWSKE